MGFLELQGCLFVDNDIPLIGSLWYGQGSPVQVTVVGNTFARNDGMFPDEHGLFSGSTFVQNVFSGGDVGFGVPDGVTVNAYCNDSWGNEENWGGGVDPSTNFSLEPRYCAPEVDNFRVASNSPLLPGSNSCNWLIGAFGEGCGTVSVEPSSWGKVKSLYRTLR